MSIPLRVLFVEDEQDSADLMVRALERGGYAVTYARVETADALRAALNPRSLIESFDRTNPRAQTSLPVTGACEWDILIADYILPQFTGIAALRLAHELCPELPVVLASGVVNDAIGAEMVKLGARDFVPKDQIKRLPAIVAREVKGARAPSPTLPAGLPAQPGSLPRYSEHATASRSGGGRLVALLKGRKRYLALSAALLLLAALLKFALAPQWTQRITPGWHYESYFTGISGQGDPATGNFSQNITAFYERQTERVPQADGIVLEDTYTVRDPSTGKPEYQYIFRAPVDPQNGMHRDAQYRGEYFLFPRNTQPITYRLRHSYIKGIPVTFVEEQLLEGLTVYLFAYKGRGEYTESYGGTSDYPGVPVGAGQEIRCADDQFIFRAWVEPLTGEVLKVDESCYSGDYLYDVATGTAVAPVLRWGGTTTGDDILKRNEFIRAERQKILLLDLYAPGLLAFVGLGVGAFGLLRARQRG